MMQQSHNNQLRRIRLLSDILEDYQDNIRRALRLIESEYAIITNQLEDPSGNVNQGNVYINSANESLRHDVSSQPIYSAASQNLNSDSSRGGLTREELQNATTQIIYDSSMDQIQCPILWEPFTPGQSVLKINGCGHIFCCNAIIEWFRRHNHCPVCRYRPVLNFQPPPSQSTTLYSITNGFITLDPVATFDLSGNRALI